MSVVSLWRAVCARCGTGWTIREVGIEPPPHALCPTCCVKHDPTPGTLYFCQWGGPPEPPDPRIIHEIEGYP